MFINRCLAFSGWGPMDQLANKLGIVSGALFLGSSDSVQLYWISVKGCRVRLIMSAYVSCVLGFSCMIYIDWNHRDSQILVTVYLWSSTHI
jgi:hypothetical protein